MTCIKGLKTCEFALRSSLTNPAFPGLGTWRPNMVTDKWARL